MKRFSQLCIIDDDPVYVYCLKRLLKLMGFKHDFVAFDNGNEALNYLSGENSIEKESVSRLILLDINMPVMNGWQFLEKFSLLPKKNQTKVIMVSSSEDPEDMRKVFRYKNICSEYLVKPLTKHKVQNLIAQIK